MTPIKRRLLYIFRGTLLRMRVTWNHGQSITLSVGYHVDRTDARGRSKWDGTRCRQNTTHGEESIPATTINRAIEQLEEKVGNAFRHFEEQDIMPTKEQLKDRLSDKPAKSERTFFDIYDDFIKDGIETRFWADGTIRRMKTQRNLLKAFNEKYRLSLKDLDEDMLNRYVAFQTSNCISKKCNKNTYTNLSIISNINLLKVFLKWAERKGHSVSPAYKSFKLSLKVPEKPVVFLDWDELMRVYNHDFSDYKLLEVVRDGFCLCCFTSLRYSDLANLKKSDVFEDHIVITTVKTSDTIIIDLNKYSKAILDKYKESDGEKAMPVVSINEMNMHLKEICRVCKIDTQIRVTTYVGSKRSSEVKKKWELITSHCGRRTFICNALSMGIAPNIVMKWTGHSDYKAMEPYIDIADKMRKSAMSAFDKRDSETVLEDG